ncbi:13685_t:CDS:2 [Acaulospora colombiana]|uniref:13685_t:CDS:1 n=1 Tax=Acaulospora colombiana TaxID=27376 RepID=A0ACA9LRV4_9GLOM|nr:13685_t:CDS:2 [Acaulospora colombiana]
MAPKTGEISNDSSSQTEATSVGDQQENIWSSILKSVASSKMVPTKSLLILGDRESGKSTLIRHLKGEEDEDVYEVPEVNGSASKDVGIGTDDTSNKKPSQNDFALSYTFVEIKDDEAEDTLARLGLYQLAGSQDAYQSLLRFSLNSTTLPDSLVVIVLDWARPWNFIETLQRWVKFVERGIENIKTEGASGSKDGWTKGKAIVDEMKEAHIRCDLKVLHPIDGAALFYTTTRQPKTFINLRQYILHRLLGSKASSSDTKSSYAFNIEPTFVERETVLIPAGWDSWIKIKVMGEGFNCEGLLQGWDMDISGRTEVQDGVEEIFSANKIFNDVVDSFENDKPLSGPSIIEAEDEQAFFARHVETLLKANNERPPSVVGPMSAPSVTYGNFGDIPDLDVITQVPSLPTLPPKPTRTKSTSSNSSPPVQVSNGTPVVTDVPLTAAPTTQNEVLANFFAALLTKKGNATQTPSGSGSSQLSSPTDPSSNISANTKPSPSRKMVEKELANIKISNSTAVSSTAAK